MNSFDSLNKRMPLKETPEYISGLVDRCAENAIAHASLSRGCHFSRCASLALQRIGFARPG